ncbi:L antigen family member 3-like isoform X1 [Heterodontus francisci]|uniref:L antigen family member 3-like isoform X1 n=1 Tax=Heterodontus francisci TaxID=7792 RepID=UPI00355BAFCE
MAATVAAAVANGGNRLQLYPFVNTNTSPLGAASNLSVPFPSVLEAQIALGSLKPDAEPRKGGISKTLARRGSQLQVHWEADEARILRVSVNAFLDHLALVLQTMDRFGPPVPR